jgi:hypothetical protein
LRCPFTAVEHMLVSNAAKMGVSAVEEALSSERISR